MRTTEQLVKETFIGGLKLLPPKMSENLSAVLVLLTATHLQEAPNQEQCQITNSKTPGHCGPARGIFQFERGGGVRGVFTHSSSKSHLIAALSALGIPATVDAVFDELRKDGDHDKLDVILARLLYWTDSRPLPKMGDVFGAFDYYLRNWRPGAYTNGSEETRAALRRKWSVNYARAVDLVLK